MRDCFIYLKVMIGFSPRRFFFGCILMIAGVLCSGVSLMFLIPLLHYSGWILTNPSSHSVADKLINNLPRVQGHLPLLFTLSIFVCIIVLLSSFNCWQNKVMSALRYDFIIQFRQKINSAVATARWHYLMSKKLQHVEHALMQGVTQVSILTIVFFQAINGSIAVSIYLVLSCFISFKVTTITVLISIIIFISMRKYRTPMLGKQTFFLQQQLQEELSKFIDGIKFAKAANQVNSYLNYFDKINREFIKSQFLFAQHQGKIAFFSQVIAAIIFSLIFFISTVYFKIGLVYLLTLLVIFSKLFPRLIALNQSYMQFINLLPSFKETQQLAADFLSEAEKLDYDTHLVFKDEIKLQDICFSYGETRVLSHIDLKIKANTTTAIVGQSGAGKSTLADLLMGLLPPTSGCIIIDNIPLQENNFFAWRAMVSYVPQETYFFNDTIRANLLRGASITSDQDIWAVLELVAIKKQINSLPHGLDSMMGERGIYLSGGERQRLALARALLRQPKVLILDEATSALDLKNEEVIYQSLKSLHGKMTIIIIAHRYSTIRAADQIIVLNQGHLVEAGDCITLKQNPTSYFSYLYAGKAAESANVAMSPIQE